jgi:hypothetical protein
MCLVGAGWSGWLARLRSRLAFEKANPPDAVAELRLRGRVSVEPMDNRFFEQPILNSPYDPPDRHWELDPHGHPTPRIVEIRRKAEFITPIPKPMLIAWQTINAIRRPGSSNFTPGFLVVTPGLTVRDRLRVLQPNDPDSYDINSELVPSDMVAELERAKIVVTKLSRLQVKGPS